MRTLRDIERDLELMIAPTRTDPAEILKETCRILAAAADYDRLAPVDQRHVHTTLDAIFAGYDRLAKAPKWRVGTER